MARVIGTARVILSASSVSSDDDDDGDIPHSSRPHHAGNGRGAVHAMAIFYFLIIFLNKLIKTYKTVASVAMMMMMMKMYGGGGGARLYSCRNRCEFY